MRLRYVLPILMTLVYVALVVSAPGQYYIGYEKLRGTYVLVGNPPFAHRLAYAVNAPATAIAMLSLRFRGRLTGEEERIIVGVLVPGLWFLVGAFLDRALQNYPRTLSAAIVAGFLVVAAGEGVEKFRAGDRVIAFHHIPCQNCFYCDRKLYAQCPTYMKVGITAGFEPAGGGFAQYIRVMDWIVERGVEKIPDGVSYDVASFVEPVNTCLKAVVQLDPQPSDVVAILGQGPIGLLFTMLVKRTGARVIATDTLAGRRELSHKFGALSAWDPAHVNVVEGIRALSEGRGADLVIVAASAPGLVEEAVRASRPGAKILLFSQTSDKERIEVSGADICKGERTLFGCYSASVDLQKQSAELVFSGALPVEDLISHRLPLNQIRSGFHLAKHPDEGSLKIIVQPQRWL